VRSAKLAAKLRDFGEIYQQYPVNQQERSHFKSKNIQKKMKGIDFYLITNSGKGQNKTIKKHDDQEKKRQAERSRK
jgi:hypothetical protein